MMPKYLRDVVLKPCGPGALSVYFVIGTYCGKSECCWPGIKRLAEDSGMTVQTVRKHIDALESAGVITVKKRTRDDGSNTTSLYALVDPARGLESSTGGDDSSTNGGEEPIAPISMNDTQVNDKPPSPQGEVANATGVLDIDVPKVDHFEEIWKALPSTPFDDKARGRKAWKSYTSQPKSNRRPVADILSSAVAFRESSIGMVKVRSKNNWIESAVSPHYEASASLTGNGLAEQRHNQGADEPMFHIPGVRP
jgi:DNA-binding transcriptional ArsR family regulator